MRGSIAMNVFLGFLSLYLLYLVVNAAQMELLSSILGQFMGVGVLAVIILFQQEIRRFLLFVGRTTVFDEGGNVIKNFRSILKGENNMAKAAITPIVDACKTLGGSNTGALLVISRNSELKFYAESGDRMDAILSKRLFLAIFNKLSPLHDGAVIVFNNKIVAARCILPITERDDIPANFGLRHRAGIGMSETTDSLIIVVSEETGQISTMKNGSIFQNLSPKELRAAIYEYLYETRTKEKPGLSLVDQPAEEEDQPAA
jgi:uncharacterized protein (TIGR00159 family)